MLHYLAVAKIILHEKPKVDNFVFYLHYRITFYIFLISSLLVATAYLGGGPLFCLANGVPGNVINTFCYFTGTFSIPRLYDAPLTNEKDAVPYPGVGPAQENDEFVYHNYYQWVTFALFFSALLFYFPQYLWKSLEGGRFRIIVGDLDKFIVDSATRQSKPKALTQYMMQHLHNHKMWSIRFFICEALNLVNVVGNMYFIDHFLGGTFLSYGREVLNFAELEPKERTDPMAIIFPKMTKCSFRNYGSSGTVETKDAFCVLSVNIINEKIYIFIWFWLVFLTAVTALWLLFRIATIISPYLRKKMLLFRGRYAKENTIGKITQEINLGDWFLIYQLGVHMEATVYGEFLKDFAQQLENKNNTIERKPMLGAS